MKECDCRHCDPPTLKTHEGIVSTGGKVCNHSVLPAMIGKMLPEGMFAYQVLCRVSREFLVGKNIGGESQL